jgi:hypothetical protein
VAWALVGSQGIGFADGGAGHVYTYPSGAPSAGDLDIICINSDTVVSTPSGYSVGTSRVNSQGSYLFYRYAVGGEATSTTINTSGNFAASMVWGRFTGGTAFDVAANTGVDATAGITTPAVSSGTIANANSLAIMYAALHSLSATIPNTPSYSSGYTEVGQGSNGTGSSGCVAFVGYNPTAGTAAESPSISWSVGATASDRYSLIAVFTPSGGGGAASAPRVQIVAPGWAVHRAANY